MGYSLRRNCTRSYKHLYNPEVLDTGKSNDDKQAEVLMTTIDDAPKETAQMSMKKGLKIFGEEGYATVKKEMQQLHDRKVMQPINQKDLSLAQKRRPWGTLCFSRRNNVAQLKAMAVRMGRSSELTSLKRNRPRLPFLLRLCS